MTIFIDLLSDLIALYVRYKWRFWTHSDELCLSLRTLYDHDIYINLFSLEKKIRFLNRQRIFPPDIFILFLIKDLLFFCSYGTPLTLLFVLYESPSTLHQKGIGFLLKNGAITKTKLQLFEELVTEVTRTC